MKALVVTAVLFLCAFGGLLLAEPLPVGTPSEGWHKWSMNLDETSPPKNLQPREYTVLLETIDRIGSLFRRMPHLDPPKGVEVVPSRTILNRVGDRFVNRRGIGVRDTALPEIHPLRQSPYPGEATGPLRAEFGIGIYRPVYKRRNPSCSIRVQLNDPWLEGQLVLEDAEGGIYLSLMPIGEKEGRICYRADRKTTVEKILPSGRSAWLPVSQERWIRALISSSEKTLEEKRKQIVEYGETRRENMLRSYELIKPHNSAQAENMLETFEQNEEIYARQAAAIAAGDYEALEKAGDRGMAMIGFHLLELRNELASLSESERAAPAYGFDGNPQHYWMPRGKPDRPSMLMNPSDPDARALVRPNGNFFRTDIDPTEVQAITIINSLWPDFNERMNEEFDWDELRRMVR